MGYDVEDIRLEIEQIKAIKRFDPELAAEKFEALKMRFNKFLNAYSITGVWAEIILKELDKDL